jgi:hypothetical protein
VHVPHNFIKMQPTTPNPGRWTKDRVKQICDKHQGKLEYLWFDDKDNPTVGYALVKDGNAQGMAAELKAHEVIELHEG